MQAAQRIKYELLEAEYAAREDYHTTRFDETTSALQAEIDALQEQFALLVSLGWFPLGHLYTEASLCRQQQVHG
jgi:hypothetical protein